MMLMAAVAVLWTTLTCTGSTHPQNTSASLVGTVLKPVDEGSKDRSFVSYRRELLTAAHRGDITRVLAMTSPTVQYHEDKAGGLTDFRREWEIDTQPKRFLSALIDVLEHGGRFDDDGQFVAPWWYTEFPGDVYEMMSHVVVIRAAVPVFAVPREAGTPLTRVSYMVFDDLMAPGGWNAVVLKDGQRGYIREQYVREPSGARAYFRKIAGTWKLVIFAEGMD